ncbi:MAG: hypothetical protein L0241_21685 [Planctomycetia bacterium]|nr:hypothetical protein [Planctomycetia bacterium]
MSQMASFLAGHEAYLTGKAVWVVEPLTVQNPVVGATANTPNYQGANYTLNTATIHFKFRHGLESSPNTVKLEIFYNNPANAALPCYFLPWLPDAATTMVLGGGANYFFTSSLSGCTVQVLGPRNAPTVTHGNARETFKAHGAVLAQTTINNMLPAANGQLCKRWTRQDYWARVTTPAFATAKTSYPLPTGYRLKEFNKDVENTYEKVGAFVYGVKKPNGNWSFWAQTTVGVKGRMRKGYLMGAKDKSIIDEVVLGAPVKIFP